MTLHFSSTRALEKLTNPQEIPFGVATIRAVGYIAGQILELGPECRSLFASSRAQQDWASCWTAHYRNPEDMEELRRIDEVYLAKILDWEETDINRTRTIRNLEVKAWPITRNAFQCPALDLTDAETDDIYKEEGHGGPRIFLGTGYVIGLVPQAAKPGDVIVRFWNCSAAMVMRPMETPSGSTVFLLIGRADAAEVEENGIRNPRAAHDGDEATRWSGSATFPTGEAMKNRGPIYVDFDLRTLQIVTAHISGSGRSLRDVRVSA